MMTASRVTNLYSLMDAAIAVKTKSTQPHFLAHIVIDHTLRGGEKNHLLRMRPNGSTRDGQPNLAVTLPVAGTCKGDVTSDVRCASADGVSVDALADIRSAGSRTCE